MRIQMNDWAGRKIAPEYITKMVRECVTQVTANGGSEPLSYGMTGDTLVLALNDRVIDGDNYPEVYVCKILRYGAPVKCEDEIEIID